LQSPQVRRALNLAVDRGSLVSEVLRGAGTPSSGPLWPEYWAADRSIGQYVHDPVEAAESLDAAGFPLKSSGGNAAAARFRITCLIPENFAVLERIALHVQKNLFKVGVDLQFKVAPLDEFTRLIGAGEFDAVLLDVISGPTPGRPYLFWASAKRLRGAYNVFGYENAEAESLFDTLRTTRNEAALRSATRRLQRVFLEDPPALFLAWNERARAIRREFAFPVQPAVDPVFSLWQWRRRTDTLAASMP
jgi:ABC-type transport system substrate-binding protein